MPEPLGAGAQGTVWRAFDASLGRDVAIKTARGSDPGTLALLKREFRLLQDLHHPGVPIRQRSPDDGLTLAARLLPVGPGDPPGTGQERREHLRKTTAKLPLFHGHPSCPWGSP